MEEEEMRQGRKRRQPLQIDSDSDSESDDESKMVIDTEDEGQSIDSREGRLEEEVDGDEKGNVASVEKCDDNEEEEDDDSDYEDESSELDSEEEEDCEDEAECDIADDYLSKDDLDNESSDDKENDCPICLNRLRNQDTGTPESCDHSFCLECILEWSRNVNTCPVDRQVFRLILARHANREEAFKQIPVEDKSFDDEDEDATYCEVCGSCDREDRLLLCDGCDMGYHCECLDPPVSRIPVEEWFCPTCVERNKIKLAQETSDREKDLRFLAADDLPRLRPRRRQIARTMVSERVRARIQQWREEMARIEDEEENQSASWLTEDEQSLERQPKTKPHASPLKRRKTKKRASKKRRKTKKSSTTEKGASGKKYVKRRRRRRRKYRKKAIRQRLVPLVTTVTSRLVGKLGLVKPPAGTTIPIKKAISKRQSAGGNSSDVSMKPLSIMGDKDDLDPYPNFRSEDPQPGTSFGLSGNGAIRQSKYSASALKSRQPVAKPLQHRFEPSRSIRQVISGINSAGSCDLLSSIMENQSLLAMKSEDVQINRDGSLRAKKPIPKAVVKMEKTGVGLSWSSDEMIKEGDEVSEQSQTRDRLDADTVRNFRDTSSGFSPRSGDSRDLEVIMKEDSLSENTNFSALENSVDQCLKAVNGLAEKSNDDDDSDTDEGAVQSSDEREENTAGKAKNVLGGETEESDKDGESDKEDNSDGSGKEDNSDESSIEEVSDNKDISEESGKEKYGSSRENTSDESEKDAADGESEKDASSEESSKESVENENSKAAESDGDNVEGELAENEDGSKATFETAVIEEVSGEDVDDDDEGSTQVAVEKSKEKFRHCENVGAINKSEDASQHTNKGEEKEQKAFDKSWTGGNKKDEWDIEPECLTEEKIKKDLQNSNRQNSVAMGTLDFLHDKKMCKSNLVQVPSDRGDCKKKTEKREVDGFSYEIESATDEFKMEPDLFGGQMVSEDVSGEPSEESELSSDEKDDKLLDTRPKVPISELPRIPKIRKDTAKVEPVEKGENLSFRSVLERVNIPDSKTAYGLWEKKEGGQRKTRWEQEKDRSRKEKEQKKDADGKDNQLSKDNSRKADGTKIPWAEHGREVDKSYVETKDQTKPKKHENSRERKEYNESKDNAYRHHSPERLKRSRRDRSRSGSRDRDYDKLHKRKERGLSRENSPNRKSQKHQTASRSPVGKEKWKDERKKMEDYPHKRHAEFADYVDLKKSKKPGEEHFSSSKMNWTPNSPQITEYNHMSNSIQSPDRQAKGPEIDPFSRNQNLSPGSEEFSVHNNIGCINDEDDDDGDSEYDPAFPTESGSPLEQDDVVEQDHSVNEFTLMDHGPRLDLRGRDCAPPGQGLLGDRGFLLHGDPGLPGMLQAQNIAFPLGIRMMPPGLQPGIPQHLLMNPMFLNRPPPFARIPRLPVNRLGWPMSPSGMVPIQNRFGARMPAGALPPRPGLLNGGFEPLPPDHGQPLPPLKQHPCDPRHMPSQPPHPVQLGRPSLQGHPPPHLPHPAHMAHPQQLHMTPPALQQAHGLSLTAHMQQQQNVQMGNLPQSLQQPNVQPIHTIQPPHQPHPSSSTQTPPSVRVPPQQPPQQKQTAQILPQKHVPHPSPTLQSSEPVPKLPQPVQPPSITRPAAVQTASGLRLADLTQITKLLEAQAQLAKLAGIDTGSKTMKDDEPIKLSAPCPSSSAKSAPIFKQLHSSLSSKSDNIEVFKIPLPPSAPPDGGTKMKVSGSRSASRRSPDFAESTEVVDMDVASPLDDDVPIELPPSPELEDMDERVAAMDASEIDTTVIELSTHEDVPASAVELCNLTNKEKYLKKLQIQERVVDEVKHAIKPHYSGKKITKDEYKDILRKAVPKICHSKSGNINPAKIKALIEAYVEKARKTRRWLEKKTKVKANGERVKTKASR